MYTIFVCHFWLSLDVICPYVLGPEGGKQSDDFIIGDRVYVGGTKPGVIAYLGVTKFATGDWAGVILDELEGKNDGSVQGVRYFQCEPKRGVFAKPSKLTSYKVNRFAFSILNKLSYKNYFSISPVVQLVTLF